MDDKTQPQLEDLTLTPRLVATGKVALDVETLSRIHDVVHERPPDTLPASKHHAWYLDRVIAMAVAATQNRLDYDEYTAMKTDTGVLNRYLFNEFGLHANPNIRPGERAIEIITKLRSGLVTRFLRWALGI